MDNWPQVGQKWLNELIDIGVKTCKVVKEMVIDKYIWKTKIKIADFTLVSDKGEELYGDQIILDLKYKSKQATIVK